MLINLLFLFLINISNGINPKLPRLGDTTPSIVFMGMENIIPVTLNGCNPDDVQIKVFPGNIYKKDDSTYSYSPHYSEGEIKLKLYYKNIICDIRQVEVRQIPNFMPVLDKEMNGFIRMSDLSSVKNIRIDAPEDFPEDMKPKISSYNLFVIDKNGMYLFSAGMRDDILSDPAIEAFKKMKPGSKIQINNVSCINKQNVTTRLSINKEILVVE